MSHVGPGGSFTRGGRSRSDPTISALECPLMGSDVSFRRVRTCTIVAKRIEEGGSGLSFGMSIRCAEAQPFPWVSAVSDGGAACAAGLQPADRLLSASGRALFGLTLPEVAHAIRKASEREEGKVRISYWRGLSIGCDEGGRSDGEETAEEESLMQLSSRVSEGAVRAFLRSALDRITCPVCLESPISKPATQCTNGHLLCLRCRRRSSRCPVCRTPLRTPSGTPLGGRCLLADQIRAALYSENDETEVSFGARKGRGEKRKEGKGNVKVMGKFRGFVLSLIRTTTKVRVCLPEGDAPSRGDIYRACAAM